MKLQISGLKWFLWCDRGNLIVEHPAKESCCFCTQIFVYEYFDAKTATFQLRPHCGRN